MPSSTRKATPTSTWARLHEDDGKITVDPAAADATRIYLKRRGHKYMQAGLKGAVEFHFPEWYSARVVYNVFIGLIQALKVEFGFRRVQGEEAKPSCAITAGDNIKNLLAGDTAH